MILIVEDDDSLGKVLLNLLQRQGYDVSWAASEKDAIERINELKPTLRLVIMDISLGTADGLELGKRIQQELPTVRVLFTSGFALQHLQPTDLVEGVTFLQKPFVIQTLVETIERALAP
jgi:DNA-binding NtrC family response regulator